MAVLPVRILDPVFGEPTLASANNGDACWVRGVISPLDQKSPSGWLANLFGGAQTGDDWARVDIPVYEIHVPDFNSAMWSYYLTNAESMGVSIVIWIHDPKDFDKRAEVSQVAGKVEKASGWDAHELDTSVTQFFFYGENTTGTGLTAGTQYTWAQFQADVLFKTWTIYRVTLDYGWEASGTFEDAWIADIKLNGATVFLKPDSTGTGTVKTVRATATSLAIAATLAPKTPFYDLIVSLHINTAGTTSENFTASVDAGVGSAYDENLLTINTLTNSLTDLLASFEKKFVADDEIDVAWANTENRTYGLTLTCKTV